MNKINFFRSRINWSFVLGLLVSLILLWPLVWAPYFTHHDDVQIIRVFEMNKCFQDGQIPCRWVPDLGGEYGYPIFNYYAPLPYYFGEFVYVFTGSLFVAAKMMFGTAFILGYVFMFYLGRKLWGDWGGMICGIFYSYAPYHAVDFYVRGAMGELWALAAFPAIFWAILRLRNSTTVINSLILGLSCSLLLLSHNLSAMIFMPFAGIFIIMLFLLKPNRKFLYLSIIGGLLALGLSAFYIFPVLVEKDLVHVDTIIGGYFSYTEHFKGVKKTLLDRSWGYGASVREVPGGPRDGLSYQVGWIHLIGLIICLYVAKIYWMKKREVSYIIMFSFLIIVISIFMIHPSSLFVWKILDPLKYLQFPWRFLEIIIFFISMVCGAILYLPNKYLRNSVVWMMLLLVIGFNFYYFHPDKFNYMTEKEFLSGKNWQNQIMRSIFDYLPIYAKRPPAFPASVRYQRLSGDAIVTDFYENSNMIHFQTKGTNLSVIQLSQYYFPGWRITIDGKLININYQNDLGLMTFAVDPGIHKIIAKLNDTLIRWFSNLITMFTGFLIFIIAMLYYPKTKRFWIYIMSGFNR